LIVRLIWFDSRRSVHGNGRRHETAILGTVIVVYRDTSDQVPVGTRVPYVQFLLWSLSYVASSTYSYRSLGCVLHMLAIVELYSKPKTQGMHSLGTDSGYGRKCTSCYPIHIVGRDDTTVGINLPLYYIRTYIHTYVGIYIHTLTTRTPSRVR
jgi:hypothetical protein